MDLNVRAFRIVQAALAKPNPDDKRKQAARYGSLTGGPSFARSNSAERRLEIANSRTVYFGTKRWAFETIRRKGK